MPVSETSVINSEPDVNKYVGEPSFSEKLIEGSRNAHALFDSLPYAYQVLVGGVPRYGTHDYQSGPSRSLVTQALYVLLCSDGLRARTAEIADELDYSERQVQKALRWLEAEGKIRHEKDGRKAYWIVINDSPLTEREISNLGTLRQREKYLKELNIEKFGSDSRKILPDPL